MNKTLIIIGSLIIVAVIAWLLFRPTIGQSFTVTSTDIKPGALLADTQVYNAHGCNGGNISPQLSWSNAPASTKSFAIICHDPDAPRKHGWYHWLVINIPAETTSVAAGGKISGALETVTDFDQNAYGGACPPVGHGIHHYNFTIYALNIDNLDIDPQTRPLEVERLIKSHSIACTTLTGIYNR